MNPQTQARPAPGGLNREEDAVADIIKLEDKSPPAPLNNAHQKFANVSSISNQVNYFSLYRAILTHVISIFGRFFILNHFSPVTPCDGMGIKRCGIFLRIV